MTDYDKLRELAENVEDPDNWCQALDLIAHGIDYGADAEYIAAATPSLILNLLEDLRITRAERDAEKKKRAQQSKDHTAEILAWDALAEDGRVKAWDEGYRSCDEVWKQTLEGGWDRPERDDDVPEIDYTKNPYRKDTK